ncbi:D-erythronate dehydrogenase [Rhodopila sp.]|jgi:nucleoside-diphosphate-sugar epimerase|uniref:D-erythronate dehydrogenase n=1 Tax=Rhodopila sp. TaxID=2480087 RepID=UPI002C2401DD|nr:D-erythronate dehydrogenase [Rhodopila sp.]HVZ07012.1 D-erythronate dehydrogenase [Rhodopila sp.]
MKISILGGGGFLGRKIAARLAKDGTLGGKPVTGLTLFDMAAPPKPEALFPVASVAGDLVELPDTAVPAGTDVIFHLAAVVSAAAEADYDLGRRVNLRGTDAVIDRCRALGTRPRVVFTSSVASFSGSQDRTMPDNARQVPGNSYGAQKAAAELILADASRRGFLDAVTIRLPTVIVRPGRPNKAASSFFSAIVREPLLGLETELPVPDDFSVWVCSPRRAVDWLLHAAAMDTGAMGLDRSIDPPGISTTVAHLLQALDEVAPGASKQVKRVEDKAIADIVSTWPPAFEALHARTLGFSAHEPVLEVVRAFIEDDLAATKAERGL